MDIQHNEMAVKKSPPREIRVAPADIDPEALKILAEAGFVWDSGLLGFRRKPTGRPQAAARYDSTIDYWFLRDQKLVVNTTLDERERIGQLQRLRILLQGMV
jgi:hypothetical protein